MALEQLFNQLGGYIQTALNNNQNQAAQQRQYITNAFSQARGLQNSDAERMARTALSQRGIPLDSPYGQRMLADIQGQNNARLAGQESMALANTAGSNDLGALMGMLGTLGNLAGQQASQQMQRDQWEWQKEQAAREALAAQEAATRARATSYAGSSGGGGGGASSYRSSGSGVGPPTILPTVYGGEPTWTGTDFRGQQASGYTPPPGGYTPGNPNARNNLPGVGANTGNSLSSVFSGLSSALTGPSSSMTGASIGMPGLSSSLYNPTPRQWSLA